MRTIILLMLCCLYWGDINAQKVDYDKIIPENRSKDMIERLVQLAWQNYPVNQTFKNQKTISEERIDLAKWQWTDNIQAQFNYADRSRLQSETVATTAFYPRYNVSIAIPLGDILARPHNIKVAKENLEIAERNEEQQKLTIRAEVSRRYTAYLSAIELLKIRQQAVDDSFNTYSVVSQKFKDGKLTVEEYNRAVDYYNEAQTALIETKNLLEMSKINIEELIGMDLDAVKI